MKTLIAFFFLSATCLAQASGLSALEQFLKTYRSGQTTFEQIVQSNQASKPKISTGTFSFSRPGKFRFDYQTPYRQQIVGDGKTLWLFDQDLNQVTARDQTQALAQTPAAILAGGTQLTTLRKTFRLEEGGVDDALDWVLITPLQKNGAEIQSIRLGFAGGQPKVLLLTDAFGQQTRMVFQVMQKNVTAQAFRFTPPAGTDMLRQ